MQILQQIFQPDDVQDISGVRLETLKTSFIAPLHGQIKESVDMI